MLPEKMIDMHTHPDYPPGGLQPILDFMDAHAIEKVVALGSSRLDYANDNVLEMRKMAPDRIAGGPYLDPRDPNAPDELLRHYDHGCRMVKLFPNHGYYPDDPELLPFFEKVGELKCGVLSHCGWMSERGGRTDYATKYARPGRFEILFRTFPDIPFVMAHMGGIDGFLEAIMYTLRTPNVYVDITPGQSYWVLEYAADFVRSIPPERVLLGTDGYKPNRDHLQTYIRLAEAVVKLGWEDYLGDIFYSNGARVIKKYGLIP